MSALKKYEAKWGYIFISLWVVGFLAFYFLPMVASLGFSLLDFQLAKPEDIEFVGLDHWRRMLFEDELVWTSMRVTFVFALITLPIGMIVSFGLAVLLNSKDLIGRDLFRTLFYMPSMIPLIASIFIWGGVLNPQTGWLNRIIEFTTGYPAVGLSGLRWLDDPSLIYFAYTYIGIWGVGNAIIINLAGLQSVPTALYEAARVEWCQLVTALMEHHHPHGFSCHFLQPCLGPCRSIAILLGAICSQRWEWLSRGFNPLLLNPFL